MKRRVISLFLLGLSLSSAVEAQEVDPKKAYDEFRKKAIGDYNDFRSQANAQYAKFLSEAWQSFRAHPAIPKPKPKEVPPVKFDDKKPHPLKSAPVSYDTIVKPVPIPEPPKPVSPIPEVDQPQEKSVRFLYYGSPYQVRFPADGAFSFQQVDNHGIAEAWTQLSNPKYNNLIRDCLDTRNRLNLCDWAYLQFIDSAATACVGTGDRQVLLKDFLFCQSGYQSRLAISNSRLMMLVAISSDIYSRPYINMDGEHFFLLDGNSSNISMCTAKFPGEKQLSLIVGKEQHLGNQLTKPRTLTSVRFPGVTANVQTNRDLIDFYNTYPQSQLSNDAGSRFQFFANTPLGAASKASLYPALQSNIKGENQAMAANILLNFVQTAFVYEYDEKVWGYDRAFFADETLFYPYCDCEDRAILFSHLMRDLLHLDVVLLLYPGHLAAAVNFTEDVEGDYLMVDGRRYVVCDPTFIGAGVGRTMTGMDNATAKVILLDAK